MTNSSAFVHFRAMSLWQPSGRKYPIIAAVAGALAATVVNFVVLLWRAAGANEISFPDQDYGTTTEAVSLALATPYFFIIFVFMNIIATFLIDRLKPRKEWWNVYITATCFVFGVVVAWCFFVSLGGTVQIAHLWLLTCTVFAALLAGAACGSVTAWIGQVWGDRR